MKDALRKILRTAITFGELNDSVSAVGGADSNPTAATGRQSDEPPIQVTPEFQRAKNLIDVGIPILIVTGGAGTGKSTFIRWVCSQFPGKVLVTAPTGLAALNVQGKTIHSLCHLPPAWIQPEDIKTEGKSLIKHADLLIVDEISMVNANLLDAIDQFFRLNRLKSLPFGGLTVVLVGDLFQLPPVITDDVAKLFESQYSTPKFFSAKALGQSPFVAIELSTSFRQTDGVFVDILNRLREGVDLSNAIAELNASASIVEKAPKGAVWLAPTNREVDEVNRRELNQLTGPSFSFLGRVEGEFKLKLPVPETIILKVGAQVMLKKNGSNWVNGDTGTVTEISGNSVFVRLHGQVSSYKIEIESWNQYEYELDKATKKIERKIVGTFYQIPLILAWALTIHSSQGLTIEQVHVDLGRGAFATGQTYVALSRCRNLDGLSMSRALTVKDVLVDPHAQQFMKFARKQADLSADFAD